MTPPPPPLPPPPSCYTTLVHHFHTLANKHLQTSITSKALAKYLDDQDALRYLQYEFHLPTLPTICSRSIYLCGNSLGLQPKKTSVALQQVLQVWSQKGVLGHTDEERPWVTYDEPIAEDMASTLLGALPSEVAVMGTLTGNLHLLMVPFYRPTPTRYKILIESQAFPSDRYAATSQIEFHGYDPSEALLELSPRANESYLRDEDYAAVLKQHGSSIAFILLPGVQYYTGQALDLAKWTALGHAYGCYVGWDLAHAIGNVGLELHAWQVDCAVWCSYKYLNGGPGCIAGLFVHDQHGQITPRLKGWWGHTLMTRFQMDPKAMEWSEGAAGFRLSNPSILGLTGLVGAMHVFKKVPFSRLVEKSTWLTSYLMLLIQSMFSSNLLQILTPFDPKFRGCQVSLKILHPTLQTSTIVQKLLEMGIVVDKREPNVIRVSPTPLYNSYLDCWEFVNALKTIFESGLMVEEIH